MKNFIVYVIFILVLLTGSNVMSQQISIMPISKLSSSLSGVSLVNFSAESDLLVAADKKGNIQLWDINSLQPISKAKVGGRIVKIEFLNNKEILVVMENGTLKYLMTDTFAFESGRA